MNRIKDSQEKISVIFLCGTLGMFMSKRVDFVLLWAFFWVCVKFFGRKAHELNLKKTLVTGLELLTQFLEMIWFLVLRIKQKYQNMNRVQRGAGPQPNRVKRHKQIKKGFRKNMKTLIKQHQAAVNGKIMNKELKGQKGPKLTNKKSKKGENTKVESLKVEKNQTKTEIFWSDCEAEEITCIGCKNPCEINKNAQNWIERNLCEKCNNDEANPIFKMWCFSCKKNKISNIASENVSNLCHNCDPCIRKPQDHIEYITYKDAEYFCECLHCLKGDIQKCQKEMCNQCTSPKPRVYGSSTRYYH